MRHRLLRWLLREKIALLWKEHGESWRLVRENQKDPREEAQALAYYHRGLCHGIDLAISRLTE